MSAGTESRTDSTGSGLRLNPVESVGRFSLRSDSSLATQSRCTGGYALLDVILAVTVFSIWGASLVGLLQNIAKTSGEYSRDRLMQYQIESLITEAKHKEVQEMTNEFFDENLEITFRTIVEPLEVANFDGNALNDLYRLTVSADWEDRNGLQSEVAEVYIYRPDEQ